MNWLVLRCSNRNTLPLVDALRVLGLQAWSPLWIRRRRFPRSSLSRQLALPCLPSFVFLAEADLIKAIDAGRNSGVPGFSIMNSYGVLVRIKDADLEGLRKASDLEPQQSCPVRWPVAGQRQRIISGAFQGLTVIVRGVTRRHCMVQVEKGRTQLIKVPPFLLEDIAA